MSHVTEGEPMIDELARPDEVTHRRHEERVDDPVAVFRGILVAAALGSVVWAGLIWALGRAL